jgi:Homeodomain-like domain
LRALALRQMDDGQSTPAVGASLGLSAKAVWQIGKRYQQGGLERALFDALRPGKTPALDEQELQPPRYTGRPCIVSSKDESGRCARHCRRVRLRRGHFPLCQLPSHHP